MVTVTDSFKTAIGASVRHIRATVRVFEGNTLAASYTQNNRVKNIEIQRVGEDSKFFGFGVTHKVNVKLIDKDREITITTKNNLQIQIGVKLADNTYKYISFPKMFVTEVNRDENTNELSITAYDVLNAAAANLVADLPLVTPYTIKDFINVCATYLGVTTSIPDLPEFDLEYGSGANFEGTETLRDALTSAAEATQTIFYVNGNNELTFKRLDKDGEAVKTITKEDYITLDSETNRRLAAIFSATELGDNVSSSTGITGTTQYVRDNPFWVLREDLGTLIDNAIAAMGGITINQFNCDWRGDLALEPGDKINLVTKDNDIVHSYLLNDTLTYDGGLSQKTEWSCSKDECETAANPTALGDALKHTYARVDKVNKEIQLVAGETKANGEAIGSLQINTDSILASVKQIETSTNDAIDAVNQDIETLTKKVETTMTAEQVQIQIKTELDNGVSNVTTSTGFTFNEEGLTVSKTGSEMTTQITEDGMAVFRDDTEVLTADNQGVIAYNLHAKTYLVIGTHSRFEDFESEGEARTGCFWIGG